MKDRIGFRHQLMAAPSMLILTFSKSYRDPRVLRQVEALASWMKITVFGAAPWDRAGIRYSEIVFRQRTLPEKILNVILLIFGFTELSYWTQPRVGRARKMLKGTRFDFILANELSALPLAIEAARETGAKVIFDAHEFYPGHLPQKFYFRYIGSKLWSALSKKYIPLADICLTVSDGIANAYKDYCGKDFSLFLNSPFYRKLHTKKPRADKIRLIHQGGFSPVREPELMVQLLEKLDERFTLDFMFVAEGAGKILLDNFKTQCASQPRIRFIDPVDVESVPEKVNEYDIGLFLLRIRSVNTQFTLPNKLFECIQGRIPMAIWPNPEMGRLIENYKIGWISEETSVESMAARLNALTFEEIWEAKQNTEIAAQKTSAEVSAKELRITIEALLATPSSKTSLQRV